MKTRTKPTDKYREYQAKIAAQFAFINASLNNRLTRLEPLTSKDRLRPARTTTVTQIYIMTDWVEEVQVYCIVETEGEPNKHFLWIGFLPKAITAMTDACKYLDSEDRAAYHARIEQLRDLQATLFDGEGRRRL